MCNVIRWTEKLDYCEDNNEKAWLYHETGYCYLTMADYAMASQCGIMSYETAEAAENPNSQRDACLLLANVYGSSKKY